MPTARSPPPATATTQASTFSSCTSGSTLPCFEIDSKSAQYPNATTHTFYDSLGREVETRTTGPDAGHDTVVFTNYNDAQHTVFTSVPFEVNSGSGWIDPSTAKDYNNVTPGGTVTYLDALGRPIATDDPLLGSSQEPGITCPAASGHHTACAAYGLGSANGDSATYVYAESIDPNNHVAVGFVDALQRTRYTQEYSGLGLSSLSSNIVMQKATQYNALNEPISVVTTDLAPQSGQSITSIIASYTYDDLGRVTAMGDPDLGTHSYSYDADGRVTSDVSGTRTIGINYDLLGRVGCIQDAAPVLNAIGACTSGLTGASYSTSYVYTHQLTGLYSLGATCSNKTGQTYASSYDAWGNVTCRTVGSTTATLSYDGLDHLTKYDAGSSGQEQYVYDASGERVLRRSTSASNTTMTVYAFGLEEHLYSGSGVNQGNTYYYSLGGMLIGESTESTTNMFLTDALGSVIETISATANSAAVQGNQVYSPYGSSRYQQGSMGTAKGFTGQYNDNVTGLDYYGSRYYDPVVGRFLSADALQGNGMGMDPYAYVGGNPESQITGYFGETRSASHSHFTAKVY